MRNKPIYHGYWIVIDKWVKPKSGEAIGTVFLNPKKSDFKYWDEHKHLWKVMKVKEIKTGLEPGKEE